MAGWKKRYVQLNGNKQISYYTDESMVVRKGNIYLKGLTIHHIKRSSKTTDSKHHGLSIYIMYYILIIHIILAHCI